MMMQFWSFSIKLRRCNLTSGKNIFIGHDFNFYLAIIIAEGWMTERKSEIYQ